MNKMRLAHSACPNAAKDVAVTAVVCNLRCANVKRLTPTVCVRQAMPRANPDTANLSVQVVVPCTADAFCTDYVSALRATQTAAATASPIAWGTCQNTVSVYVQANGNAIWATSSFPMPMGRATPVSRIVSRAAPPMASVWNPMCAIACLALRPFFLARTQRPNNSLRSADQLY